MRNTTTYLSIISKLILHITTEQNIHDDGLPEYILHCFSCTFDSKLDCYVHN